MTGERPAGGEMPGIRVWQVTPLLRTFRQHFETTFPSLWVEGEVTDFHGIGARGHAYFSLKDAEGTLPAVMFSGNVMRCRVELKAGLQVRAHGKLSLFEKSGKMQVVVDRLEEVGEGLLQQQFEERKRRMAAEGLFDAARKRPLPALPRHIGVVTSKTGAAIRDILNVLGRRFGNVHVVVAHAAVQGKGAEEEIAEGIRRLNEYRGPDTPEGLDVLIVGRGGGSIEDLWCFNEEAVVRAVHASRLPVISAVGHEIDWTLCDYAADVRAPTPSAAAEMVVQGKEELAGRLEHFSKTLGTLARNHLLRWRRRLEAASGVPGMRDPMQRIRQLQQRLDYGALRVEKSMEALPGQFRQRVVSARQRMRLAMEGAAARGRMWLAGYPGRLEGAMGGAAREAGERLRRAESTLRFLNPRNVLARGYTITRQADGGGILRGAEGIPAGTRIRTEWADGCVESVTTTPNGEGSHDNGKQRETGRETDVRGGAGAAGRNRAEHGKRQSGARKNGGGVRGGADAGQGMLFQVE